MIANGKKFTADRFIMTGGSFFLNWPEKQGLKFSSCPEKAILSCIALKIR
jgi:hypothetical protein